jgi:Leucine-rich repeat (LRR) protein
LSVLMRISALPDSIGQLSSLAALILEGNKLTGTYVGQPVVLASVLTHILVLPESIGELSSLVTLELRDNKLTGILFLVFLYVQLT